MSYLSLNGTYVQISAHLGMFYPPYVLYIVTTSMLNDWQSWSSVGIFKVENPTLVQICPLVKKMSKFYEKKLWQQITDINCCQKLTWPYFAS